MGGLHFFRRATGDIGLSSLAGGNDFGFLIAHGIVFYLFYGYKLQTEVCFTHGVGRFSCCITETQRIHQKWI